MRNTLGIFEYTFRRMNKIVLSETEFKTEIPALAYTDGEKICILANEETINRDVLLFVMCHEVAHIFLKHIGRVGERDHIKWNLACDHVINRMFRNLATEVKNFEKVNFNQFYINEQLHSKHPNCSADEAYDYIVKEKNDLKITTYVYKDSKLQKVDSDFENSHKKATGKSKTVKDNQSKNNDDNSNNSNGNGANKSKSKNEESEKQSDLNKKNKQSKSDKKSNENQNSSEQSDNNSKQNSNSKSDSSDNNNTKNDNDQSNTSNGNSSDSNKQQNNEGNGNEQSNFKNDENNIEEDKQDNVSDSNSEKDDNNSKTTDEQIIENFLNKNKEFFNGKRIYKVSDVKRNTTNWIFDDTNIDNIGDTPEEKSQIERNLERQFNEARSYWNNSVRGKQKGDTPGTFFEALNHIFEIKLPWYSICANAIRYPLQGEGGKKSWRYVNKYSRQLNVKMKGRYPDEKEHTLIACVDSSGSMDVQSDIAKFFGIVKDASSLFKQIIVLVHDHKIQDRFVFTGTVDTNMLLKSIKQHGGIAGRGGTSHIDVFDKIENLYEVEKVSSTLFFTDYYSDVQYIYDKYEFIKSNETIWLLTQNNLEVKLNGCDTQTIFIK
jgi:hypothetical protein